MRIQKIFSSNDGEKLYSVFMSEKELSLFSMTGESLYDLSLLKNCKGYPKFVIDYINLVQSNLEGGQELCKYNFPVVPMPLDGNAKIDPNEYTEFFDESVDSVGETKVNLAYKNGKWFEKSGLFFKKYTPIQDPAEWLCRYVLELSGNDDLETNKENQKCSDYRKFMKAYNNLSRMVGRYRN